MAHKEEGNCVDSLHYILHPGDFQRSAYFYWLMFED
jgi:hypothetical protein